MDPETTDHFAGIITLAQAAFEQTEVEVDTTPERAILRLRARYGQYTILVSELLGEGMRKYRYYVLRDQWVEAGFDNSPDPRAIRLKYGRVGSNHTGEYVPHRHEDNKARLVLTDEMTFETFLTWLKENVSLER